MKTISNWRDMRQFGIDLLTGEACALSYRGLFDLTPAGLDIVRRTIGCHEIKTGTSYNGGDATACLLMPYAMLEPLAVFALFERERAQHVVIEWGTRSYSGLRIHGFDGTYTREQVEAIMRDSGSESYRIMTYPEQRPGVTFGLSNIHQMSGRYEG